MGTRDQVYGSVSSLVLRPSNSEGGGGNDYEPRKIRREEPHHTNDHGRAYDRATAGDKLPPFSGYDMKGYKTSGTTCSDSPLRHMKVEPYAHDYDCNGRDFDRNGQQIQHDGQIQWSRAIKMHVG